MIEWAAVILEFLGLGFNAHKKPICWFFWIVGDILWIIHTLSRPEIDFAVLSLWAVFGIFNIYGWKQWRR